MSEQFQKYKRKQVAELRPYKAGEDLSSRVSISAPDQEAGSPKPGDMIARNPKNHDDQWLVAKKYFQDNFEVYTEDPTETYTEEEALRLMNLAKGTTLSGEYENVHETLKKFNESRVQKKT